MNLRREERLRDLAFNGELTPKLMKDKDFLSLLTYERPDRYENYIKGMQSYYAAEHRLAVWGKTWSGNRNCRRGEDMPNYCPHPAGTQEAGDWVRGFQVNKQNHKKNHR